jgi:hypothetical protein
VAVEPEAQVVTDVHGAILLLLLVLLQVMVMVDLDTLGHLLPLLTVAEAVAAVFLARYQQQLSEQEVQVAVAVAEVVLKEPRLVL